MQGEVLKQVINDNKKIITIYNVIISLYYLIFIALNRFPEEYYWIIYGKLDINNVLAITLLLFNMAYIILISYKYLYYEIDNLYANVILRINNNKWIISKIIFLSLFILIIKLFSYIEFNLFNLLFNINYGIDIEFYLNNLYMFIIFSYLAISIFLIDNKMPLVVNIFSIIFFFCKWYHLSIITMVIYVILAIKMFKFKKS